MKLRFLLLIPVILIQSCASLVSRTTWPLTIQSNPDKADFVIKDRDGKEVSKGSTPATINLKSGAGYLKRGKYTVTISSPGYTSIDIPVKAKINGWYFGNLVFGGFVGMLIVDPITGAMYKIKNEVINPTLTIATSEVPSLQIIDIADVPALYKEQLVRLK